jgi:disulfide bond formation protein DsbB
MPNLLPLPPQRLIPAFLLAACLAALGGALTFQYGLKLQPCILCLYQRVPYILAAALAAHAMAPWTPSRQAALALGLAGLLFLANTGIAIFHTGVEQHWWEGTEACVGAKGAKTIEELRRQVMEAPLVRCDQIPWEMFGISMAGINALGSPFLALAAFIGASKLRAQAGSSSVSQ